MIKFILSLLLVSNLQGNEAHLQSNLLNSIINTNPNALAQSTLPTQNWQPINLINVSPPVSNIGDTELPDIKAKSFIAIDVNSGSILYENHAHEKKAIASLTKLMTSIIILEENNLNEIVTISNNATAAEGQKIWLYSNEKITVRNLLKGILIHSGNDSAIALAEHNAGSVALFVEKMNAKAALLGLKNTHFGNPVGYDTPDNYSTAYDLSVISLYAMKKNFIRETVIIKETEIRSADEKTTHKLETTNQLLSSDYQITGLKTGTTPAAGLCLITSFKTAKGKEILTVLLDSPARFTETKIFLEWLMKNFSL